MLLSCFSLIVSLSLLATANTEIRNLDVSSQRALALPPSISSRLHTLNATSNEYSFKVRPAQLFTPLRVVCEQERWASTTAGEERCPHERWVALDLDDAPWTRFSRFTVRLSWPAFYPADFDIALYTPDTLAAHFHADPAPPVADPGAATALTRVRYARIRVVDTGIRKPSMRHVQPEPVPFTVILEPLYLGILPATVVPTLLVLVPILAAAALTLPWLHYGLARVAAKARYELYHAKRTE